MLTRFMLTKPRLLLHLEGATILLLSVLIYSRAHSHWGLFALLFFAPDIFMLGYLANPRIGAALYNLVHTLTLPGLLAAFSLLHAPQFLPYSLIWVAHIGLDRMLGYGLKYPTQFKDTHLQHV